MDGPYIAEVASLLGDPARANMLVALMHGQALTATELSLTAGIGMSTGSGHLSKLVEGRLLRVTAQGRHRYFQLASPKVAEMLELVMGVAADGPPRHRPKSLRDPLLAEARTCYNHLAGRVAVSLADSLRARGLIELEPEAGVVTERGAAFLAEFGVPISRTRGRTAICRPCLDWSERRLHIGGALGAALLTRFVALEWVKRDAPGRIVRITSAGRRGLAGIGVDMAPGAGGAGSGGLQRDEVAVREQVPIGG